MTMRSRVLRMLVGCGVLLVCAGHAVPGAPDAGGAAAAHPADARQRFLEANRLYVSGEYERAIDGYAALVDDGYHSLPVYYNLGNACVQLGEPGRAVLYYRRALLIAPRHADTRFNLAHVTAHLAYQPAAVVRGWGSMLLQWLWARVSMGELVAATLCLYWVTAAVGVLWLLGRRRRVGALLVLSGLCLLTASGLALGKWHAEYASGASVITEDTRLLSGPGGSFDALAEIGRGAGVWVLQTQGQYHEVRTEAGGRGWVLREHIGLVSPYAER